MEEQKYKIVKTVRACKITTKVLYILSCVACLTFAVLAIVFPCTGAIETITRAESAIIFSVLALYAFMFIGLLWNACKFFESIEQAKTPFNDKVSHYLKKSAIFTLIVSVVPAIIGSILIQSIVPESEFVFRVELVGIITGALLFLVGLFFKYGKELQKQDDETL